MRSRGREPFAGTDGMSEAAPIVVGRAGGGAAAPKDLRALVHDMGHWRHAPEGGVNLVIVSVASALPEAKRKPQLVNEIAEGTQDIAGKRNGTCYQVSQCDFAIMAKLGETQLIGMVRDLKVDMLRTIERNFPGSFGTIDQSRLVL